MDHISYGNLAAVFSLQDRPDDFIELNEHAIELKHNFPGDLYNFAFIPIRIGEVFAKRNRDVFRLSNDNEIYPGESLDIVGYYKQT